MASTDFWEQPMLAEFKAWYTATGGFGDYLRHFLAHYGPFFREHQETHSFVYTKLHKEFSANLDAAVSAWRESKGMTEEHLEAMLRFGKASEDTVAMDIVNMMVHLLEYPSWIEYMFSLKRNPEFMDELWNQSSRPGWEKLGGAELKWETRWWEQWDDNEWANWQNSVVGGDSQWEEWTDKEWEDWWAKQDTRHESWEEKKTDWTDRNWLDEMAPPPPTPKSLHVAVPDGLGPGAELQVSTPEGQVLTVTVPENVVAGGTFAVSYLPS